MTLACVRHIGNDDFLAFYVTALICVDGFLDYLSDWLEHEKLEPERPKRVAEKHRGSAYWEK